MPASEGCSATTPPSDCGRRGRVGGGISLLGFGLAARVRNRPVPHRSALTSRALRWLVVVVGAALLVGGIAVSSAVVSSTPAAAAASCAAGVGEGQVRVVIVVDPGPGGPVGPGSVCLAVSRGTTGAQLLAERAGALGASRPRYADSGLLCGIDGFPRTGCGETLPGGGYRYWAYFSGNSGSWSYGTGNPFIRRLADGDIEGWRFVEGTGTGQDPAPRLAPSPSLFPPLAAPPTAPTIGAGTTPAPSSGSGSGSGPSVGSGRYPGAGDGSEPGTAGAAGEGPAPTAAPTAPGAGGGTEATTTTASSMAPSSGADGDLAPELASSPAESAGGSGGPVGLAVAGLLIAALVVAAIVRSRRRR